MDDSKIIELFFMRRENAIAELSEKYGSVCLHIAKNILNSDEDAEECVNDTYLAVWNSIPPQKPESLPGYICRIVRNIAVTRYYEKNAMKRNSAYDIALDEIENQIPAASSVEEEAEANEVSALIGKFLETLSEKDRIMFVRRYYYADPVSEIAALFKTRDNYVSVRLARIRKALKKYLTKEGVSV